MKIDMKNIWFIRTDKDGCDQLDVTVKNPNIYSIHGICGDENYIKKHKNKIFPKLVLNKEELSTLVKSIKNQLITDGLINKNDEGKKRCDYAILCWLDIMKEGDVVFVRNKKQEVLVCKIIGYVSEKFFDTHCFFQRPVEVLASLTKEPVYEKLWKRTLGRKTIERNANNEIKALVFDFLRTIKS